VWDNAGEDNALFLAGGIAFNLMLAALPFLLLLLNGLTALLPILYHGQVDSTSAIRELIHNLLPAHSRGPDSPIDKMINDLFSTRRQVTIYSGIGFIWFSTRLFGSLRTVLASVFDIESERGIIAGKIFDAKITVVSTLLFVASVTLTTYVNLASHNTLINVGLATDLIKSFDYWIGRAFAFAFLVLMFFALYKYLPIRRVPSKAAWVASAFTSIAFETARSAFSYYTNKFNPASLYSGTLAVIIIVISWSYYAAVIFILGGEVGQVFELRRVRKAQREVLTD
jgi:membrane protein